MMFAGITGMFIFGKSMMTAMAGLRQIIEPIKTARSQALWQGVFSEAQLSAFRELRDVTDAFLEEFTAQGLPE